MTTKIRLKRLGAKKRPFYRLVVTDSRRARKGRAIDTIGYYNPLTDPATVKLDEEKVSLWLSRGVQLSDTAKNLLKSQGLLKKNSKQKKSEIKEEEEKITTTKQLPVV